MFNFIFGIIATLLIIITAGLILSPKMGKLFFLKKESKLTFENTIKMIKNNINLNEDWTLQSEKDFTQNYDKSEKKLPFRLYEYKIGNPKHSFRVNSIFPAVATFMPASIAIVEYENKKPLIYVKNTRLMGYFFSGDIKKIMTKEVPAGINTLLAQVI